MLKNKCFLAIMLIMSFAMKKSFAQKDTIFINRIGTIVPKDSANYYRFLTKLDSSLYKIEDYFMFGSLQMTGYSTSPSVTVKVGKYTYYDSTGHVSSEGEYVNGFRAGTWHIYFKNTNKLLFVKEYRYPEKGCYVKFYDSVSNKVDAEGYLNQDENWTGEFISYFFNSDTVQFRKHFNGGLRDSVQLEYYKSGVIKRREVFDTRKFVKGEMYNEEGKKIKYFPAFVNPKPNKPLYDGLKKNVKCFGKEKAYRLFHVRLKVYTDGTVSDVEISDYPNSSCVAAMKEYILNTKKWKPALKENVPINFTADYWIWN